MHELFRSIANAAGLSASLLGSFVLAGWLLDIGTFKSPISGLVAMKVNTALCFVLTGISLRLQVDPDPPPARRWAARACAALSAVVGVLTVVEYFSGTNFGIDNLILRAPARVPGTVASGRMALTTALNFTFLGVVLAFLDTRTRLMRWLVESLTIAAFLVAFVAVMGYVYGVRALYGIAGFASVAIHTAGGFAILSIGVLAARPDRGLAAILAQNNSAGASLRRLLPMILTVPLLVGWLQLKAQQAGHYDTEFGLAVTVTACTVILAALSLWHTRALSRAESARQAAERDAVRALKESEARKSAVMNSALDAIVSMDHRGLIVEFNPAAEKLFRCLREEAVGKSVAELLVPATHREEHRRGLQRYLETGEESILGKVVEFPAMRADGAQFLAEVAIVRVQGHEPALFTAFMRDITERARTAELFRLGVEAAPTGMLMVDEQARLVLVNSQVEALFGYARQELLGKSVEQLVPERFRNHHMILRAAFQKAPEGRLMGAGRELFGLRKDGSEFPLEIGLNPLRTPEGDFVLCSVIDISERHAADEARRLAVQLRERSRFFELSLDLVCIANTQGNFVELNPAFTQCLGYSNRELLERPFLHFVHPDDHAATLKELEKLTAGVPTLLFANRYRCKDGSYRWLQWRAAPDQSGLIFAVARDVTEDLQKSRDLAASLKEREVLLQEMHHRVKNNLQVIASLINMQTRQLSDASARAALEECRARVYAIALIHEKLYQSRDYARIPFSEYARSLAEGVVHAAGVSPGRVRLTMNIETLALAVDKAIPCGLILNELITNALKHAFPNERHGSIEVEFRKASPGELVLLVADDGVGLPDDFTVEKSHSLGLELVRTLVEQLEGRLEIARGKGATFSVIFPVQVQP